MPVRDRDITLFLGPDVRGAPDSCEAAILDFVSTTGVWTIASQQVSHVGLVSSLARASQTRGRRSQVLLERDYLFDERARDIWVEQGRREPNRRAFAAMLRAGIDVRADERTGELFHVNFAIRQGADTAFATSANLTAQSLRQHLNWAAILHRPEHHAVLTEVAGAARNGDFRGIEIATDQSPVRLRVSSQGGVLRDLIELVDSARTSITGSYFNVVQQTPVVDALARAAQRGVEVSLLVDGDQGHQGWDAGPQLRDANVGVSYYPGALTGATGRMHYKMMVIDGGMTHLGTANLSRSAERSLELGLTVASPVIAHQVSDECRRLGLNSSRTPPPLLPQ